ncbi:MAG: sensor histidine kinase [Saprospiraceae bacterium]|nr:sensor histidine kinase [Saprospiraceae bacterium]
METNTILLLVLVSSLATGLVSATFCLWVGARQRKASHRELYRQRELLGLLLDAQEAERNRLGEDLHDELGPMLTALRWKTTHLSLPDNANSSADIRSFHDMIDLSIEKIRQVARNLVSPVLLEEGLLIMLRQAVLQLSKNTALHVRVQSNTDRIELDKTRSLHVFRSVLELLNNAMRHGDATELLIDIRQQKDYYIFTVSDNGKGMPDQIQENRSGLGLTNVNARASYIGGHFFIHSQPGGGTKAVLEVPIRLKRSEHA